MDDVTVTGSITLDPQDPPVLSAIGDEGTGRFQLATELMMTPSELSHAVERLSNAGFVQTDGEWIRILPAGSAYLSSINSLGRVGRIGAPARSDVNFESSADSELDQVLAALRSADEGS